MADYCLDSNVVSDILRGEPEVMRRFEAAKKNNDELFIPSIVYYKIVRGLKAAGKTQRFTAFQFFYKTAKHLPLDKAAIDKAVEIYVQLREGQLIEDNDIYIAAISIVNDYTLVTSNVRHFSRVENLKFVNWRGE